MRVVMPAAVLAVTVRVWRPARRPESAKCTRSDARRPWAILRPSSLTVVPRTRKKLVTRTRKVVLDARVQPALEMPAIAIAAFASPWRIASVAAVIPSTVGWNAIVPVGNEPQVHADTHAFLVAQAAWWMLGAYRSTSSVLERAAAR